MSLSINGKDIPYYFFDDEDSILARYALLNNSLPSYFWIKTKDYELKENAKLKVKDVRDYFSDIMPTESEIIRLTSIFSKLTKRDIILLFLLKKYRNESTQYIEHDLSNYMDMFKKLDKSFSSVSNIYSMIKYYTNTEIEEIDKLKKILSVYEKNIILMSKLTNNVDCEELKVEEIILDIKMQLDFGITLIDVFDSLDVSDTIPFIYMYRGSSLISKVYKNFIPPKDWIENISTEKNKLYFKILNSPKTLDEKNINKIYSDGWWDENNNIEITMSNNYLLDEILDKDYIQNNLTSSIDEGLSNYKILKSTQSGIRSIFKINNFSFDKIILSDMIDNLEQMSFFIFINEYQYSSILKTLTSTTKSRFMIYLNPGNIGDIKNSISLTITPQKSDDDKEYVIIRISKCPTQQKAESVRKIFCLLMKLYLHNYDSVFKIYETLLPGKRPKQKNKLKKGGKEDKKSGKRLIELKKQRSGTFRSGYSGLCQPMSHQPYLIPPSKVEDIKRTYGDHKVMEYKDPILNKIDHYACEPREPGEPQTYIYPGLRKNTSKNQEYREKVPFVPCCFTEDQYTKPASKLKKQLITQQKPPSEEENMYNFIEMEDINDIGHILGYNKSVSLGRFGQLPYYMNFMMKNAQYKEIEKGKQLLYPVFRYGMINSPDSFFHCLEKVMNLKYASMDLAKRKKHILNVRKNMTEENLAILKQEFYDYTENSIKKILLNENAYIDPGMWFRLAEEHYKCNIYIFETSSKFPHGAFVYPRFSEVFLACEKNPSLPYILIMKYETEGDVDWPFQCELISKFTPHDKKRKVSFTFDHSDTFIKEIALQFKKSYSVDIVFPINKFEYKSISDQDPLFENVRGQYIDSNGKLRVLMYDENLYLMVNPLPPMNFRSIPNVNPTNYPSMETVISFTKQRNLEIISQRILNKKIVGLLVLYKTFLGYIPFIPENNIIPNLDKFDHPVNPLNPFEYDTNSKLELLNRNKKIAMIMMQYTLFEYSHDPLNFSDRFVIIENYKYEGIHLINKYLTRHNKVVYQKRKLIVNSQEMKNKLLSYLEIELLNDKPNVEKYKERLVFKDYYNKIKDYRHTPLQVLFIGLNNLREWIDKQNYSPCEITTEFRKSVLPYFYKNYNISKSIIFIVQSTAQGTLEKALILCETWRKSNINLGHKFDNEVNVSNLEYNLYSTAGLIKKSSSLDDLMILKIKEEYFALLPFRDL
jgi:hypothetical protein